MRNKAYNNNIGKTIDFSDYFVNVRNYIFEVFYFSQTD